MSIVISTSAYVMMAPKERAQKIYSSKSNDYLKYPNVLIHHHRAAIAEVETAATTTPHNA